MSDLFSNGRVTPSQLTRRDTQDEAYKMRDESLLTKVKEAILAEHPRGLTCEELVGRLGREHQAVSAAINRLMREGVVGDTGRRGINSRQRPVIEWVGRGDGTVLLPMKPRRVDARVADLVAACKAALADRFGGDDPCCDKDPITVQLRAAIARAEGGAA